MCITLPLDRISKSLCCQWNNRYPAGLKAHWIESKGIDFGASAWMALARPHDYLEFGQNISRDVCPVIALNVSLERNDSLMKEMRGQCWILSGWDNDKHANGQGHLAVWSWVSWPQRRTYAGPLLECQPNDKYGPGAAAKHMNCGMPVCPSRDNKAMLGDLKIPLKVKQVPVVLQWFVTCIGRW